MRDRREVLKLLAGGTAAAASASLITSNTAFADGGTASFRPTCSTSGAPSWEINPDGQIRVTVSAGTTTCQTGWTGSTQVRFRINSGTLSGGSGISSGGNYSNFVAISGSLNLQSSTFSSDTNNVRIDVIIRRVCTNNTNNTRRAWCCALYSRTANYDVRGGTDRWESNSSGTFPTGTAGVSSGNGCVAP